MLLLEKDKEVLKQLGSKYMEFANLPIQKEKLELWKALNRSKMERPMVCIDQLPWNELNVNDELTLKIEDPYWRRLEWNLRTQIYKWKYFPVDMVLEPYIIIPKVIENTGYGLTPEIESIEVNKGSTILAKHFTNILKDYEDLSKIKDAQVTVDNELSTRYFKEAKKIFENIAPVIQGNDELLYLGVWDHITEFMGVEAAYLDIMDRPEFVHACVNRFTESVISGIKEANELGVHNDISNICHCSYIYTDELLPDFGKGKGPISQNCWAYGLAQLFTSVSPKVTEEFELPYISRMAEYFGMIYYGCCDRLDDRLDIIKRIPNLRKVSCSPWSDRKNFAENIGTELIMSAKPTPAFLADNTVDWDNIKKDLQLTVDLAKSNNVNLELILKDISTVKFQPERLKKWAEIVMGVVEA